MQHKERYEEREQSNSEDWELFAWDTDLDTDLVDLDLDERPQAHAHAQAHANYFITPFILKRE